MIWILWNTGECKVKIWVGRISSSNIKRVKWMKTRPIKKLVNWKGKTLIASQSQTRSPISTKPRFSFCITPTLLLLISQAAVIALCFLLLDFFYFNVFVFQWIDLVEVIVRCGVLGDDHNDDESDEISIQKNREDITRHLSERTPFFTSFFLLCFLPFKKIMARWWSNLLSYDVLFD